MNLFFLNLWEKQYQLNKIALDPFTYKEAYVTCVQKIPSNIAPLFYHSKFISTYFEICSLYTVHCTLNLGYTLHCTLHLMNTALTTQHTAFPIHYTECAINIIHYTPSPQCTVRSVNFVLHQLTYNGNYPASPSQCTLQ